jgi:tetratricopeptide (TPR) repeat protein
MLTFLLATAEYLDDNAQVSTEIYQQCADMARECDACDSVVFGDCLLQRAHTILSRQQLAEDAAKVAREAVTAYEEEIKRSTTESGEATALVLHERLARAEILLGRCFMESKDTHDQASKLFTSAIKHLEAQFGDSHYRLVPALLALAEFHFKAQGDIVVSEALFTECVSVLERALLISTVVSQTPRAKPSDYRDTLQLLIDTHMSFAQLLEKLEWNGRARIKEAEVQREKAASIVQKYSTLHLVIHEQAPFLDAWVVKRMYKMYDISSPHTEATSL